MNAVCEGWLVQTRNCADTLQMLKDASQERCDLHESLHACEDKLAEEQVESAKRLGKLQGAMDHIKGLTAKLKQKEEVEVDANGFLIHKSITFCKKKQSFAK